MANGAAIGPTNAEINALPIQSPSSVYDLRNANVALSPQALQPPPGPVEDQPPSAFELSPGSFGNAPQFSQPGGFDRLAVQPIQPDFQQPQFQPAPQHDLQPLIDQYAAQMQQHNQQRGHGVMRNLMTSFLGGAGRAMLMHAGLPTPEMEQQRRLENLVQLSNAQSQQDLRNVEMQRYAMDIQRQPVIGADGQPLRDENGQVALYPKWQAEKLQEHHDRLAEQRPERWTPEQQVYAKSYDQYIQEGKTPAEAHALLQKQRADITPDRETFNYYTRPKAEGGLGLSPAQAYSAMHPRRNLTMGSTDVKDIADAIESGDQPPTLTGLYRNAAPVRAELARRGVPIARMEMDWQATKKYMGTLNGPQQVRLRQAIETASDSLDKIQNLYDEWRKLAPVSGFKIANHAALVAMKNLPGRAGAVANALDAQIADLTSELGNVYMGGNSPTDHSLKLAQQNLSSDWGPDAFAEAMKQARLNIGIRKNSITHGAPAGVSGENTYMPPQPASPQTPAAVDPFAQFGGKSR